MANPTPETIFTRDILGNFMCNTFSEALNSGPFDVIIVGGGTFGLALAQNLFFRSRKIGARSIAEDGIRPPNFRILVLEAGPFLLPEHVQVRVRHQEQRQRGPKVYSLHAPEVECIGRGKARAPYEFGCKVSIATPVTAPRGGQFVLHAKAPAR
jgi:hypothetical protein